MSDDPRTLSSRRSSRRQSSPGEMEKQKQIKNELDRKKRDRKFEADKAANRKKRRGESGEYENIMKEYPEWKYFSGNKKRHLMKNFKTAPIQTVPGIAFCLSAGPELDKKFDNEFMQSSIAKLSEAHVNQLEEFHQNCDGCLKKFMSSAKTLPISKYILREFFRRKNSARGGAHNDLDEEQDGEDLDAEAPDGDSDFFDPNDHQEGPSTGPVRAPKHATRSQNQNGGDAHSQGTRNQEEEKSMKLPTDHWRVNEAQVPEPRLAKSNTSIIANPCSVFLAIRNTSWREAFDLIESGCPLYTTDDIRNTINRELNEAHDDEEIIEVLESLLKRGLHMSDLRYGQTLVQNTITKFNKLLLKCFWIEKFSPEMKAKIEIKNGGMLHPISLNSVIAPLTTHGFIEPIAESEEATETGLLVCGMEFDPIQNEFVVSKPPKVDIKVNGQLCLLNEEFNNFELLSAKPTWTYENGRHGLEVIMHEKTTKFLVVQLITYNLRT